MASSNPTQEIPLTQACLRQGLSYNQMLRRVLIGEVQGRQVNGRWVVTVTADAGSTAAVRTSRSRVPAPAA